jgi:WD40 repeat protein
VAKGGFVRKVDHLTWALAYSPDGKLLATVSADPTTIILWDPATGKEVRAIKDTGAGILRSLTFSPDSKLIAAAGGSHAIRFWDVATGKEVYPGPGHHGPVLQVAYSPDGKTLASCGLDRTLCLWDVESKKDRHRLATGFAAYDDNPVCALAFAPDSKTLAALQPKSSSEGSNKAVHFWDVKSGEDTLSLDDPTPKEAVRAIALSPDGTTLATCTFHQGIRLISLPSKEEQGTLGDPADIKSNNAFPERLVFSPDGRTLAVGCFDGYVRLWDWRGRTLLRQLAPEFRDKVAGLAYSPDGQILATCWGDNSPTIHLWHPGSGALLGKLEGPKKDEVIALAFSPDGRTLASACLKEVAVRLWDVFSGKEVAKLDGHRGPVRSLAFSPDGKILASGSTDTTVLLWDVRGLNPPPAATAPEEKELEQLWADLQRLDAARAFQAVRPLAAAGDRAAEFLKTRVKAVPEPDPKRLARLLDDLDDNDQTIRDAASKELRRLGRAAEAALRQRLKKTDSPEVKGRIERLLGDLARGPDAAEQAALRAVTVLEQVGSESARALLKEVAAGAKEADLTRQAGAALQRLDRRARER